MDEGLHWCAVGLFFSPELMQHGATAAWNLCFSLCAQSGASSLGSPKFSCLVIKLDSHTHLERLVL